MVLKGLKLRIYPNDYQKELIDLNFGANRFVWNNMLDMMIKRHENNPDLKALKAFDLNYILTAFKREHIWLKKAESTSLQVTNKDLFEAYRGFFSKKRKFPRFKSKKFPKQSYQSKFVKNNVEIIDSSYIKLPKLGVMKYKNKKSIPSIIKYVTIRKSLTNKYYAILTVDEDLKKLPKTSKSVGIDMGVSDLVICSNGRKYKTIRFDKKLAKKKHYWEKRLARRRTQALKDIQYKKEFGLVDPKPLEQYINYTKAKLMVAKYSEKIANQRKDYLHKITRELVENNDMIVIEDLKTKNLLKNHKLSRAIANQSWRALRLMLEYKCEWYGKKLLIVNPFKTSQICSNCGYDDGKHGLDIREWDCPNCSTHHDRDINASKNILNIGLEQALVK
ncbi:RNA-guided endonuclease TnpB family protein [Companilactobacillus kimchii]|uniref:Transposase n=2 Tax=Companilactobacillus kimchii TaxID=2801452 RepID=A0ABR5NU61_9LACO|nr:RNA-guided endonuclease TnpB family protein [Companilactobacillus kimchii]KAE9558230.1 transposase [Companilactobacillus kimchii]KAE9562440.1 transposase [Companilactobacillus kimchii]KRK52018.1 transposase [Companilactobacillus kimchii DSM 13961 = JCM 10707]GEO48225.1 transposase [Companilactobacillus paralimentarius]